MTKDELQAECSIDIPAPAAAASAAAACGAVAAVQTDLAMMVRLLFTCADRTRLSLLVAVHAAPGAPVKDLAVATGLTPNTVTQSLAALHASRTVRRVRDGRYSRWYLHDDETHALLHHLGAPHSELHPNHAAPLSGASQGHSSQ